VTEFKRDAAKDQRKQHHNDRNVKRRHDDRIGLGKSHEQSSAAEHQPCLVAIPVRCDRTRHLVAFALVLCERKKNADTEIKAVEQHVHGDGDADHRGPDQREIPFHGFDPISVALLRGRRPARLKSG
jgi:hypothetical protein